MTESLTARLNHPEVLAALATLVEHGILNFPEQANVFCAYCGDHIIFAPANHSGYDPLIASAVGLHRASCEKFLASEQVAREIKFP